MNLEDIQSICKRLPKVTEDVKWKNDLCFSVDGKMFCVASLAGHLTVSFKVNNEEFDELTSTPDIIPAPYVARYKWVLVQKPSRLTRKEWEQYITESYTLVKNKLPKKTQKRLTSCVF